MSGHKQQKAQRLARSAPNVSPGSGDEPKYTRTQIIGFLRDARVMTELDYIAMHIIDKPSHSLEAIQSLKNQLHRNFRKLLNLPTSAVVNTALNGIVQIPDGQRHAFDITGESSKTAHYNAEYRVFSQGLMVGETVVEPARVYRNETEGAHE